MQLSDPPFAVHMLCFSIHCAALYAFVSLPIVQHCMPFAWLGCGKLALLLVLSSEDLGVELLGS